MFAEMERIHKRAERAKPLIDPIIREVLVEVGAENGITSSPVYTPEKSEWHLVTHVDGSYVYVSLMIGGRGPLRIFLWVRTSGEQPISSHDQARLAQLLADQTRLVVRRGVINNWIYYNPTPVIKMIWRWMVGLLARGR